MSNIQQVDKPNAHNIIGFDFWKAQRFENSRQLSNKSFLWWLFFRCSYAAGQRVLLFYVVYKLHPISNKYNKIIIIIETSFFVLRVLLLTFSLNIVAIHSAIYSFVIEKIKEKSFWFLKGSFEFIYIYIYIYIITNLPHILQINRFNPLWPKYIKIFQS